MAIYLHELVNVVPGRAEDYLDSMAEHHGSQRKARGERGDSMLGLFTVLEATGTWPLAVNVWQNVTWQRQAEMLQSQFEPRAQNPELKKWWLGNLNLRTGGFDRIVDSTPYSPDVEGHRARGTAGKLFLHQIVRVAPGRVADYLDAFGADGVAAAESAGAQLVGAYRVCMYDHEAIVILAFREPSDFARYQREWHAAAPGGALARWRAHEDAWVRGKDSLVLKPRWFLRSPWHP
ncbi:MAG: hypothetical protein AB1689_12945 [Thermodesulfobacteriota bacterium]